MKTYPLNSDKQQLVGFEVSNLFLSSRGIAKCVRRVKGCEILTTRRSFSAEEVHVRFSFARKKFIVWEPFGGNSRLWVGPEDGEEVPPETIGALREEFKKTSRFGLEQ
jgi:hypothetical protein